MMRLSYRLSCVSHVLLTALFSLSSLFVFGQTPISPTTWGGTSTTTAAGPSNFSPLPATTTPGAAVISVSQWNRGPGVSYNAGASRYNSNNWTVGGSSVATVFANGDYLTFTVTNSATTELRITGVNIGFGQASGTGPNTFGLMYRIGAGPVTIFSAAASGPSPTFTGTAIVLCAGETATFYMCGWGGSGSSGTWSINNNASITASYVSAVSATAGSSSPVPSGTPLTFSSTATGGLSPYNYSWSGPLSFSSTSSAPSISSPTSGASGNYSLTVTDAWGCSAQATTSVTVTSAVVCSGTPTAGTASATPSTLCGSGSATISLAGSTVASGITYQWLSSATDAPGSYTAIGGATSSTYSPSSISATTYYRCAINCTLSAQVDTSSSAMVTVNPLPTISAPGGDYCSGTSGFSITATGALTYTWSPATGLSATTGSTVISTPASNTTYTVTGTDALGCIGTNTLTINYNITPGTVVVSPTTITACEGASPQLLTATGGLVGPTTVNSGTITIPATLAALSAITNGQTIAGIPAGATITGASVNIVNFGSQYQDDYIINIKAPNGNVLNLIKQRGSHTSTVTTLFANTILSSAAVTPVASGSGTFTGMWLADAVSSVGAAPYMSNVTTWSSLFSVPNGVWTLSIFNNTGFTNTVIPSAQWSITLDYSYQAPISWSPTTNLYTDAAGTISYTGGTASSVYFNPTTAGTATVTATATNTTCTSNASVATSVNPLPAAISGGTNFCTGATTTFSSTPTGGTWSSSNSNVVVTPATGAATAALAGTSVITYTLPTGCERTIEVTVNAMPPAITGTLTVCEGGTTTLSNSLTGGTWSSSNTNASIDVSTGVVTGAAAGTADITYTSAAGCLASVTVTVNVTPNTITGANEVCEGSNTTLSCATTGGTWSSSNANANAGVATGIISGITAGTSIISYTTPAGCFNTTVMTINALPSAISGTASVCVGLTSTLSATPTTGTWTSSNANATVGVTTGTITGVIPGTAIITYTLPTTCKTSTIATVNSLPASISGTPIVCQGFVTTLSNTTLGGAWSSSNTAIATINPLGIVSGVAPGTATITYMLPTGCYTTTTVVVNQTPAAITGSVPFCQGNSIALSSSTFGGTWSSTAVGVATVSPTGTVDGITAGTSTISYTLFTGCYTTIVTTVNGIPPAIIGTLDVCVGATTNLFNTVLGGTWTSSNTAVAGISSTTGIVSGVAAGTTNITYSLGSGCSTVSIATVNPVPAPITGLAVFCANNSTTLANTTPGGSWSTGVPSVATINASTGLITALATGTTYVSYTLSTGCYSVRVFSVNPSPTAIIGAATVCRTKSTVFSCTTPGGVWISGNTSVAAITMAGIVTGIAAGTSAITYTLPSGCFTTDTILVYPIPTTITGSSSICIGATTTLTNGISGGTWSSTNPVVAPISLIGEVTGAAIGTAIISYMLPNGCYTFFNTTVNTLPLPYTVLGGGNYCSGGSGSNISLSGSDAGNIYRLLYSGTTITGTLPGTGSVITFSDQSMIGTYTMTATNLVTGCSRNMIGTATVGTQPLVTPLVSITTPGVDTSCSGVAITLVPSPTYGGTLPIYQWKVNGVVMISAPTYTYTPADGDVVSVKLTSNETCRSRDTATASSIRNVLPSVLPTVGIMSTPNDTVCESSPVTILPITSGGGASPAYIWMVNGSFVAFGSSYSFTPANHDFVSCSFISSYRCRLADTVESTPIVITVLPELFPSVTITAAPGFIITPGASITFTANVVNGGVAPSYQWSKNGISIAGATNSSYTTTDLNDGAIMRCNVTSSGFCGGHQANGSGTITYVPTGGIINHNAFSSISIAPNPNKGRFVLSGSLLTGSNEEIHLSVANLLGQNVYSNTFVAKDGVINENIELTNQLSAGIYILNISSNTGNTAIRFVID